MKERKQNWTPDCGPRVHVEEYCYTVIEFEEDRGETRNIQVISLSPCNLRQMAQGINNALDGMQVELDSLRNAMSNE